MSESSEDVVKVRPATKLAYPRSLAISTVRGEIEHGQKLLRTMRGATAFHPDDFNEWKQRFGFWDSQVIGFLERSFTDDSMKRRYEGPLGLVMKNSFLSSDHQ
ncbi:MAG: hypothetical protein ACYDAR_06540 [Thermomicrobiales bacterium]